MRLEVRPGKRAEWGTGVLNGLQAISDWFFGLQIYLPIAEVSLNIVVLLAIGGGVGLLSGLFGVGGGFLMTPLLIFIGVPPAVAVATQSNQVVAASVSGVLAHWSRGNVDFKMGGVLLGGGLLGSSVGVLIFSLLKRFGQIDLVIAKFTPATGVMPGQTITYNINVQNTGASVTGATIADVIPAELENVQWTSTAQGGATGNTVSGTGNINETVDMPAGSTIVYVVTASVRNDATGTVTNTATISPPQGLNDADPLEN